MAALLEVQEEVDLSLDYGSGDLQKDLLEELKVADKEGSKGIAGEEGESGRRWTRIASRASCPYFLIEWLTKDQFGKENSEFHS